MNKTTTTADLRQQAANLDFDIDDYNNGDPASWKLGFSVTEAEAELKEINDEIAFREEAEDRDRMDYLDAVEAANGR